MFVRGSNPVWSFVDLTGHQFDDTFYMSVLQNTLPYLPATVYHQPDGIEWNQPIRFFANGTLPIDIFFDPGSTEQPNVYRLEFRKQIGLTPSQSDPLIYLVENYIPSGSGGGSPSNVGFSTDNQITNAQFSLVNFNSPLTVTSTSLIEVPVAPGWVLELDTSGDSGSATINQVAINSNTSIPTNAPYALRLTLTGWTGAKLKQRFQQNGINWQLKNVASSVTARLQGGPQNINAVLVDNTGTPLIILNNKLVNGTFNELTGHALKPSSTDTVFPPDAFLEYQLLLPGNIDIFLTSFQVTASSATLPIEPSYNQDSIDRQIDHTFHFYKPQLEFKPIPSLLTGWDFPLNPQQFNISSFTTTPIYVWDQTIMCSSQGQITVAPLNTSGAMLLQTQNANECFYMLQYLTGGAALKTVMSNLSVNIDAYCVSNPNVTAKVFLYYSSGNGTIPLLSSGNPTIGSITNVFTGQFTLGAGGAGWVAIPQSLGFPNSFTLALNTHSAQFDGKFSGFLGNSLFGLANTNHNFAIVVTFVVPTVASFVAVNSISLVPGDIPTRPAPQTTDEVLRECESYYEKSYNNDVATGSATNVGAVFLSQSSTWNSAPNNVSTYATSFTISYKETKVNTPLIKIWSVDGTADNVQSNLSYVNTVPASAVTTANVLLSNKWAVPDIGKKYASFSATAITGALQTQTRNNTNFENSAAIYFQYELDSRLGKV